MTAPGAGPPLLECERADSADPAANETRFEFLSSAMELLTGAADYETTMARVAQLAVPRFADWATVHVRSEQGFRRVAAAHHDPATAALTTELLERYEIDLSGPNGAAAAVRTATPTVVEHMDDAFLASHVADPRQREIYSLLGSKSGIAAPMLVQDKVVGLLTFLLGHSGRRYHAGDVRLAEDLARLCAVAVDNAERRRLADDALWGARERARRLSVVAELGQMALASSDIQAILDRTVGAVAETLSVSHSAMLELTEDCTAFRTIAGCGWHEDVYRTRVAGGHQSQAGYTFVAGAPVVVSDMATETRFEVPPLLRSHGITSSVTVIVRTPEAPMGVLGAYSENPREFSDDDVVFLRSIANIVGTAIGRSRDDAALRSARQAAEDAQERLSFLAAASAALTESLDSHATIEKVASLAVPRLADWCAVEVRFDPDDPIYAVAHADPARAALALEIQQNFPPDRDAPTGPAFTIRTGAAQLFPEISEARLAEAARSPEHAEALRNLGVRSAMVVPLVARDRTLGALTLAAAESGRRYDSDDLELAADLARRAAVAIDNARLYEEHERVASTLQASLLPPTDPEIPGFEVATAYRPAGRGIRIGGDFYDAFETTAGWAVAVGDVCGKGTDAAAITGLARHTLRAAALRDNDPGRLLGVVNEALIGQIPEDRFCTLATALFRAEEDGAAVTLACGGHPYPMILRSDGEVETVVARGPLLGAFATVAVDVRRVHLRRGDLILLFTDGVIEARHNGDVFGERRLVELLGPLAGQPPAAVTTAIETAVVDFQEGFPRDDLAIVAVRVPDH